MLRAKTRASNTHLLCAAMFLLELPLMTACSDPKDPKYYDDPCGQNLDCMNFCATGADRALSNCTEPYGCQNARESFEASNCAGTWRTNQRRPNRTDVVTSSEHSSANGRRRSQQIALAPTSPTSPEPPRRSASGAQADQETMDFQALDVAGCRSGPRSVESCIRDCQVRLTERANCLGSASPECAKFRTPGRATILAPCEPQCPEIDPQAACTPIAQFVERYPDSVRTPHLRQALADAGTRMEVERKERERTKEGLERQRTEENKRADDRTRERTGQANICYQACMQKCTKRFSERTCAPQCLESCTTYEDGVVTTPG